MSAQRQLAAILFADITGYTALMQKDEQTASTLLRRFQSEMELSVAEHNGRIVNFYGDGALCTFQIPIDAVRCAMELQSSFQDNKKIVVPVRIGIHSGTVTYEGGKIYGDSVNLASRIEGMSVPGAVLFSKKIRDEIKNQPDLKIKPLGSFSFKNVEEEMEVFALANEGFVVPKKEVLSGVLKNKKNTKIKWLFPASVAAILLLVAMIFQADLFNKKEYSEGEVSLAVVPFRNISGDDSNSHFGMGMASEIRTKLSLSKKFAYLSSLQATATYADSDKSPKEIGQELSVDYLLMGIFQVAGDDIRVNIELLDAESGESLEELPPYQNNFTDIFKIQSEIANQVLQQFSFFNQSEATENEYEPDVLAYGHYLKGIEITEGEYSLNAFQNAITQYETAIQLDSNYLSAWVKLIDVKTSILFSYKNSDSLRQEAREIMGHIETHFPESWEKNMARGFYSYAGLRQYETGLQYFLKVLEENPEDFAANKMVGAIYKRYIQPEKAFHHFKKAINQNPLSSLTWSEIGIVHSGQGDRNGADKAFRSALNLGSKTTKTFLFGEAIIWGDMTMIPEEVKVEFPDKYLFYDHYFKQDWGKCLSLLDTINRWGAEQKTEFSFQEDEILQGKMEIHFIMENMDSSKYYAQQLLSYFDRHPDNINFYQKANALAILGKQKEAIDLVKSGNYNNGLWVPIPEGDKMMITENMLQKIKIYTLQSEHEKATATLLETNEKFPNFGDYNSLRSDPLYNRIKKEHPPFAKALAELKLPELVPFEGALKD